MVRHIRPGRRGAHSGFTIVELAVVVAITGILMAVAIPGFREVFATQRTKTAAKTLFSALKLARSEAQRMNGICDVYVVPVIATDWAAGIELIGVTKGATAPVAGNTSDCKFDATGDGDTLDAGDLSYTNPLAIFPAQEYVLGVPGTASGATLANVAYNRLGRVSTDTSPVFNFCDDDNLVTQRWTVSLDAAGLPQYSNTGDCPVP